MTVLAVSSGTWIALGVAATLAILAARILARRFGPRPLAVAPDDPEMLRASELARARLDEFERLRGERPDDAYLKFVAPGETEPPEHVWGRVLEASSSRFRVEPVASGPLDPDAAEAIEIPRDAIEDWQVELADGRIAGGFTQRVLFAKGRAAWGRLPAELAEAERRYAAD
ncbi:MAG: hypothetical protein R3F20_11975 [Planctomycetota bacterium]